MPSKKSRVKIWEEQKAKRVQAPIDLGKADKRWREVNGLSQQNIHNLCQAASVNLFNSQIAYWENGKLTPKSDFWYGREYVNFAIAENDFPPTQGEFNRGVLDRLKNADPFLNYLGEVATARDFFELHGGTQPLNDLYTKVEKLTDKFIAEFAEQLEKTFKAVARDQMLNNKEAWDSLCQTKGMKAVKEKKFFVLAQDMLRGEGTPTVEEASFVFGKYKQCPCVVGLREIVDGELNKKMEDLHSKMVSMAA